MKTHSSTLLDSRRLILLRETSRRFPGGPLSLLQSLMGVIVLQAKPSPT